MAPRPTFLSTCYAYPWALVRRAGDTLGKRPSTRMAFITKANAIGGEIVSFSGYVMNNDMNTGWTKNVVEIGVDDIVKSWRHQPSFAAVVRVKKRMPVITADDQRWNWDGRESASAGVAS